MQIIKYTSSKQLAVDGFDAEFRQKLNPNNKWVILADAIPWDEFVRIYAKKMSRGMGSTSISPRLAIASMIIKHLENLDDRGVVEALEKTSTCSTLQDTRASRMSGLSTPPSWYE